MIEVTIEKVMVDPIVHRADAILVHHKKDNDGTHHPPGEPTIFIFTGYKP